VKLAAEGDPLDTLCLDRAHALFLDFDGTLTELGADPDAIVLPEGTHRALERLSARLEGALARVSGRDLRDLMARTPAAVWRIGGHGLEVLAPGADRPDAPPRPPAPVLTALREIAARPGVRLELKGPVVALHYRAAPEAEGACLAAAAAAAATIPGLVHQAGKMVVEVKPAIAHKGRALRRMMEGAPFAGRLPVMLGDDTTDEDAIVAAQALGGIGVKVGGGPSAAILRAPEPAAVRAWIAREAG